MKVHYIHTDGTVVPDTHDLSDDFEKHVPRFKAHVHGNIELVSVIYDGKPATMLVNEVGAATDPSINPGGQLPPNARATAIYWTATIIGVTRIPFEPLTAPMIHGNVVLIEKDKREL